MGVYELYAESIGQLAARHRVSRAWEYKIYKEIIDLGFELGMLWVCKEVK